MLSGSCCNPGSDGAVQGRHLSMNPVAPLPASFEGQGGLLAKELNGLSFEERERIYDEVHGVSDIVDETPDFVASKLQEMRDEIAKIKKKNKKALERAYFLRPSLQNDDKAHLLFLRATRFDAAKAAGLMARHFEHKSSLFGDHLLAARITVDDLGEQETKLLHSGAALLLNSIDRGGRGVYLMTASEYDLSDRKAFLR
jgi:hypothetical protein